MNMPKQDLDAIDQRILENLQNDARMSNVTLAGKVGLSPSPCLRRVGGLEDAGVIRGYATLVLAHVIGVVEHPGAEPQLFFLQLEEDRQRGGNGVRDFAGRSLFVEGRHGGILAPEGGACPCELSLKVV